MLPDSPTRASSTFLAHALRAVSASNSGLSLAERLAVVSLAGLEIDAAPCPVVRTHGDLAARWSCSTATVKRVLASLALRGLVRIERRTAPDGGAAPSAYRLDLSALGVAHTDPTPGAERPEALVTRAQAGASDPDLRSGDPDQSERAQSPTPEHSPVESMPAVREAATVLRDAIAAAPALAAYATSVVAQTLAAAVTRKGTPVRDAARGIAELGEAVELARVAGAPWSASRIAIGLRAWALAARRVAPSPPDRAAREGLARLARESIPEPARAVRYAGRAA